MTDTETVHRPAHLVAPSPPSEPIAVKQRLSKDCQTVTPQVFENRNPVIYDCQTVTEQARDVLQTVLTHKKALKPLDAQEAIFVSSYIATKNAKQSALDAGYSMHYASSRACHWVKPSIKKNPKLNVFRALHLHNETIQKKAVNAAIEKSAAKISSKVIDTQYVLDKSVELLEKSNGDIPTHTTTRIDPATKAEVIVEHYDYNGAHASKAIELIAKNKKIKAFSNEVEINADSSLAQLLINIAPNNGLPVIEHDIQDAEIVEDAQLMRPSELPDV